MSAPRRLSLPALPALAIATLLGLSTGTPALAQNTTGAPIGVPLNAPPAEPVPSDPSDPPGRVGRISDLSGQVWLFHPDAGEWVSAERNRPLTTGDRLATDGGARVQVHIGSTTVRLDGGTELEVLKLDDEQLSLQLHSGSAAVRLRSREMVREFEMRTPEGRFTAKRAGRYRFDRADDASHVTVYAGQALYEGPGSALTVEPSQRAEFFLDSAGAAQYSVTDPERDAFAGWNADRDRADDRSASARYVSPEMTGVEDLDRHGRWQQSPEYGPLWAPTVVASGWAPYTTGRWAWVSPWGWTWVDEAPWGFAPFHYGRWVWYGSRWCWAPGTFVRRPVYAPALVAWIGGPRLSVSVTVGGPAMPAVGWVPLAPREVYVPGYRVSPGYVRNVNVTHVTNITNITTIINNPQAAVGQRDYQNRKYPHAVTVVPTQTLAERRPVAPAASQLRMAPVVREIIERPSREVAIAAPLAPRRPEGVSAPQPGVRIEPPTRSRATIGERPSREGRSALQAPAAPLAAQPGAPQDARPAAPQDARPAAPQGPRPGGVPQEARPGNPRDARPAEAPPVMRAPEPRPAAPVAAPQARPAAPAPAVPAAQPLPPPSRGAIGAGRAVVPAPQTAPSTHAAPTRQPAERAAARRMEAPPQAPVQHPVPAAAPRPPAQRAEAPARAPQAERAPGRAQPQVEPREARREERGPRQNPGRSAD